MEKIIAVRVCLKCWTIPRLGMTDVSDDQLSSMVGLDQLKNPLVNYHITIVQMTMLLDAFSG